MRCDVELVQGQQGETKRVLINGQPVAGLLSANLSGGPRKASTLTIAIHPTSVKTVQEVNLDGN